MAVTITSNPMLAQEKGSYRGIGIEGHYELGKGIVVDNVVAGSTAAKKLKLRAGDVVNTFNGEDIRYFTPSKVDTLGGQLRDAGLDHKPIELSVSRNGQFFKTTAARSKADVISSDGRQATRVGYGSVLGVAESVVRSIDAVDHAWKTWTEPARSRFDALRMDWQTLPTERPTLIRKGDGVLDTLSHMGEITANRLRQVRNFCMFTFPVQVANIPIKTVALLSHGVKAAAIASGRAGAKGMGLESQLCSSENLHKTWEDTKETAKNLAVATVVTSTALAIGAAAASVPIVSIMGAAMGLPVAVTVMVLKADVDLAVLKKFLIVGHHAKNNPETLKERAPASFHEMEELGKAMKDSTLSIEKRRHAQKELKEKFEEVANAVNPQTLMPAKIASRTNKILNFGRKIVGVDAVKGPEIDENATGMMGSVYRQAMNIVRHVPVQRTPTEFEVEEKKKWVKMVEKNPSLVDKGSSRI